MRWMRGEEKKGGGEKASRMEGEEDKQIDRLSKDRYWNAACGPLP